MQPLQGESDPSVTQLPAWGAASGSSPVEGDATGSGAAAGRDSTGQPQQQQEGAAPVDEDDDDDDDYDEDDEDEWCTAGKSRNAGKAARGEYNVHAVMCMN